MSEDILTARNGEILEITLNRPERGNAASDEMIVRLGDLFEQENQARAIVLRGAGDDFCTGRAAGAPPSPPPDAYQLRKLHDIVFRCYGAVRRQPAPVISLVQGKAAGFGCALACVADITLAADVASFQVPEFAHNIMPTMVGSSLVDRVSVKTLQYLIYTAKPVNAERALAFGLVNEIAPRDELESVLDALLQRIVAASRPAVFAVKEYALGAQGMDIEKAVKYARSLHAMVNTSGELRANFKR